MEISYWTIQEKASWGASDFTPTNFFSFHCHTTSHLPFDFISHRYNPFGTDFSESDDSNDDDDDEEEEEEDGQSVSHNAH